MSDRDESDSPEESNNPDAPGPFSPYVQSQLPPDDRPRGILSKADRQFLRGKKQFKHQESYANARARTRERVENAFLDMIVLDYCWEEAERDKIFANLDIMSENNKYASWRVQHSALRIALAFIYSGVEDSNQSFKQLLQRAVQHAKVPKSRYSQGTYEVDFTVREVEPPEQIEIETVVEKVKQEEFDNLTPTEMFVFIRLFARSEEFDPETVSTEFNRRVAEFFGEDTELEHPLDSDLLFSRSLDYEQEE